MPPSLVRMINPNTGKDHIDSEDVSRYTSLCSEGHVWFEALIYRKYGHDDYKLPYDLYTKEDQNTHELIVTLVRCGLLPLFCKDGNIRWRKTSYSSRVLRMLRDKELIEENGNLTKGPNHWSNLFNDK